MITYSESMDGLTAEDLRGFFVGWPNPPSARGRRHGRAISQGPPFRWRLRATHAVAAIVAEIAVAAADRNRTAAIATGCLAAT